MVIARFVIAISGWSADEEAQCYLQTMKDRARRKQSVRERVRTVALLGAGAL